MTAFTVSHQITPSSDHFVRARFARKFGVLGLFTLIPFTRQMKIWSTKMHACSSVGHTGEPRKNGRTDRYVVSGKLVQGTM